MVQLFRSTASGLIALRRNNAEQQRGALLQIAYYPGRALKEFEMQAELVNQSNVPVVRRSTAEATADLDGEALVAAAMRGSTAAFEKIVKKYEARVFRLAHTIAHRREDAEEIMQNAFVQVFKNISRFRGDSSFYTWLTRITINEALMRIRQRRLNEISIDEPAETGEGSLPHQIEDWGPSPEQRYSQTELQAILATTISKLPQGYRTVFQLRDVEGFSTEETAEMVGLTPCAVKTRLRRARAQLRGHLSEYFKPSLQRRSITTQSEIRSEMMTALGIDGGTSWHSRGATTSAASMF